MHLIRVLFCHQLTFTTPGGIKDYLVSTSHKFSAYSDRLVAEW